ncbi:peroxide stress protein YaaA [Botrimarina sp.]|uniref:peroxide stress protein YaaA n=1 Tax=Botrimarina sp. TaxID=2795802 RepID=UPI0032EF7C5C
MLILLSPAKTLDFEPVDRDLPATKPALHSEANKLASMLKGLSRGELSELMGLSDQLAETAHGYTQGWRVAWDARGSKQAVLAFRGDVYQGLDADSLTDKQLEKSQSSVRVLSGLYGVLRPLDKIQPYRLEMGCRLSNPRGKDLYAWWGDRVTDVLNDDLDDSRSAAGEPLVVNLASNEYWSVVNRKRLHARVVTPVFKERHGDRWRVVSFYAKRARGLMTRHLLRSRSLTEKSLLAFDSEGYRHNPALSKPDQPVFSREAAGE